MHETSTKDSPAEGPVPGLGKLLRERREAMGLSLQAVAERTRIRSAFLQSFESDDYEALPAAPYAVGFLRQYAKLLGLDAEQAVKEFRCAAQSVGQNISQHAIPEISCSEVETAGKKRPGLWVWLLIALGAILCAGLLVYGKNRGVWFPVAKESTSPAVAVDEPTVEIPAPQLSANSDAVPVQETSVSSAPEASVPMQDAPAPIEASEAPGDALIFPLPAGGAVFRIASKGTGWVEIEADRRPLQNYDMQPGTRVEWTVHDFAEIRISIPGGMQVWLDGREVALPDTCMVILGQPSATVASTAMSAHPSGEY